MAVTSDEERIDGLEEALDRLEVMVDRLEQKVIARCARSAGGGGLMAVADLHEAAKALQGAHEAIERLLAETEPMERACIGTLPPFPCSDEDYERLTRESGYGSFVDAVSGLIDLLQRVERIEQEELDERRAS